MSIYFEVNTSIDHFLVFIPALFIIVLVLKYPVFSEIPASIIKIKRIVLVRGFMVLMSLWLIGLMFSYVEKVKLQHKIENNDFFQISGCIKDFKHEKPKPGTIRESFSVNSVSFTFTNYDSGPYFNEKLHRGQFLKNDRCVSIDYVIIGNQNKIIKILG